MHNYRKGLRRSSPAELSIFYVKVQDKHHAFIAGHVLFVVVRGRESDLRQANGNALSIHDGRSKHAGHYPLHNT